MFVAVGEKGTVFTLNDGTQWTARTSGTRQRLNAVVFGNGKFVAVGCTGIVVSAEDGIDWEISAAPK